MSANLLREAASVLRERAEAATPGPWDVAGADDEYVNPRDVVTKGEPGYRYIICEHAGQDAAYIATVHPAVGLALADWLESQAGFHERMVETGVIKDHEAVSGDPAALAVAAAILGRSS